MFLFFSDVRYLIITPDEPTIEIPIIKSDTPIIMIVFDELPLSTLIAEDNKIDSALFPGFSLLAQSSTMFTNAVSVAEYTTRAVPALLTGIYPASKSDESGVNKSVEDWVGMPSYIYHPKNLFTALSGRYDLRVFETVTTLCPDKLCPHDENTGLHLDQRLSGLFMDLSLI